MDAIDNGSLMPNWEASCGREIGISKLDAEPCLGKPPWRRPWCGK